MAIALLPAPPPWHEIMDCVLSLCVGVAAADGEVNSDERRVTTEFFSSLSGAATFAETVVERFAAYSKTNRHPGPVCKYLALACTDQQKLALVTALVRIAEVDGELNAREIWFIERTAFVVELADDKVPDLRGNKAAPDPAEYLGERLAHHCRVLAVQPPLDQAALKRAYRASAMKAHPDTVVASGEVSWEEANKRFIEVRQSYETLVAAGEAGVLGTPPVKLVPVSMDTLSAAALALWSGFPRKTWSTPAKTLDELRQEKDARDAQAAQIADAVLGERVNDPADVVSVCPPRGWFPYTGPETGGALAWSDPLSGTPPSVFLVADVGESMPRIDASAVVKEVERVKRQFPSFEVSGSKIQAVPGATVLELSGTYEGAGLGRGGLFWHYRAIRGRGYVAMFIVSPDKLKGDLDLCRAAAGSLNEARLRPATGATPADSRFSSGSSGPAMRLVGPARMELRTSPAKAFWPLIACLFWLLWGLGKTDSRNPNTVAWGWFMIVAAAAFGALVVKRVLDRDPVVVLDREGFIDHRMGLGLVRWTDITAARVSGSTIIFQVRDPAKYLARLSGIWSVLVRSVTLSPSYMDATVEEVCAYIDRVSGLPPLSPPAPSPPVSANACPRCGTAFPPDGRFCPACGVSKAPFCSRCHLDLPPGAAFCAKCGERVDSGVG